MDDEQLQFPVNLDIMTTDIAAAPIPPPRFHNYRKMLPSFWDVHMSGMFHCNATDEEVSQFLIQDLHWEDNLLIEQAEGFLSSLERQRMIDYWVKRKGILQPRGPGQYEWTAKSKAPESLQFTTRVGSAGKGVNETFKACIAEFLNEITDLTINFKGDIRYAVPRCRWMAFHREQAEKMCTPDMVLVMPGADPIKLEWADVISAIEVKWRDQPDVLQRAIRQLANVAASVFHHQPDRQWFPCLSLCGTFLRMSVFTRGGSLHTIPLDLQWLKKVSECLCIFK